MVNEARSKKIASSSSILKPVQRIEYLNVLKNGDSYDEHALDEIGASNIVRDGIALPALSDNKTPGFNEGVIGLISGHASPSKLSESNYGSVRIGSTSPSKLYPKDLTVVKTKLKDPIR